MTPWEKIESRMMPEPNSGCWLWPGAQSPSGYGLVVSDELKKSLFVHRVSYEENKGPIPKGLLVMHSCDVRACLNPDHLSVGTNADNVRDKIRKGRANNGSKNNLSPETVLKIFNDPRKNLSEIARSFSVHPESVCTIKNGAHWSLITGKIYERKTKTHCARGHPWVADNIGECEGTKGKKRYCLVCGRESIKKWRDERAEKVNA